MLPSATTFCIENCRQVRRVRILRQTATLARWHYSESDIRGGHAKKRQIASFARNYPEL
jgi:hypothetical protein